MPQIAPATWKVAASFYWFREFSDGRIEHEYDPDDGHLTRWGPPGPVGGLIKFGWKPMTPELAALIRAYGEFGRPVSAALIEVKLGPDDVPIVYKDNSVVQGLSLTCKSCGLKFRRLGFPDHCPKCKAERAWKPFIWEPAAWEETVYGIGIEGRFEIRFDANGISVE